MGQPRRGVEQLVARRAHNPKVAAFKSCPRYYKRTWNTPGPFAFVSNNEAILFSVLDATQRISRGFQVVVHAQEILVRKVEIPVRRTARLGSLSGDPEVAILA